MVQTVRPPRIPQAAVQARVKQIRTLLEGTELDYEREKLNERIARLAGGVAIIQVTSWLPSHRSAQLAWGLAGVTPIRRVSIG